MYSVQDRRLLNTEPNFAVRKLSKMKSINLMVLLLFVVATCKAAKFPIHLSHQGNEQIVPVAVSSVNQDCDFCTDFMLEDCYCEDVTYCKNQFCYVPDKCDATKCDGNGETEVPTETKQPPVTEKIAFPVTAQVVGPISQDDCDFCTDFMLEDCYCEDVTYCKNQFCYVPDKCDTTKCDGNDEAKVPTETKQPPVTEEIVPATAQAVGPTSRAECQYCELMYWGCNCDDVNYCLNKWNCPVKPLCLEKCPTTTKQPPVTTVSATTERSSAGPTTTKQPPVTIPVTTASATTKRPTADPCGNCAYMIWGCNCADAEICRKWQCTVEPRCLEICSGLQ